MIAVPGPFLLISDGMGGDPTRLAGAAHVDLYIDPTHTGCVPLDSMVEPSVLVMAPLGGVERTGRVVRFVRLIQRPGRVLGVLSARAACGGNPSRPGCHSS
jgi:hypothetical protein